MRGVGVNSVWLCSGVSGVCVRGRDQKWERDSSLVVYVSEQALCACICVCV